MPDKCSYLAFTPEIQETIGQLHSVGGVTAQLPVITGSRSTLPCWRPSYVSLVFELAIDDSNHELENIHNLCYDSA